MNFREEIQQALETGNPSDELLLKVENLRDSYIRKEQLQERYMPFSVGLEYPEYMQFTNDEITAHHFYNRLILERNNVMYNYRITFIDLRGMKMYCYSYGDTTLQAKMNFQRDYDGEFERILTVIKDED